MRGNDFNQIGKLANDREPLACQQHRPREIMHADSTSIKIGIA